MQVLEPNDVKIYNLAASKSLPDWITDRKRRQLLKKDIDVRRRLELLQDFGMPGVSTTLRVSPDGHYILATGVYKPRVRCYEVDNLSMKFERCMDSEIVTFELLSEDYSKMVFLQHDRYVEFHGKGGRYYRLRIPKYGRDMKYNYCNCDLYFVGVGPDIFRLNLERGQFMNSFETEASEINKIALNSAHQLVVVGTKEGKVEAWDPRSRNKVGVLDCAFNLITKEAMDLEGFPSITSLQFDGALTLGVGTATGQVLLYDIRSDEPFTMKDHMYSLPIRDINFHEDYVLSMDINSLKLWNKHDGKIFTYIESGSDTQYNNFCHIPNSGLLFIANESTKILSYYIPSLGPAPKWCSFLDNLTEELEETNIETVYDDYKFVTKKELSELGLAHLIGSKMLRAYMHGYFIDIRLYRKAKSVSEPFIFEQYKKKKIREQINDERKNRVKIHKLPNVNKDLALKLMDEAKNSKKKKQNSTLLEDDRFQGLFKNPDFQIDVNSEEYRLLNPVVSRLDKSRRKELQKELLQQKFDLVEDEEIEGKPSSDEESDESSDDERQWVKEVKQQHKLMKKERELQEREREAENERIEIEQSRTKMYELKTGFEFSSLSDLKEDSKAGMTLEERLYTESTSDAKMLTSGNREFTYTTTKGKKKFTPKEEMERHRVERKHLARKGPPSKMKNIFKRYRR